MSFKAVRFFYSEYQGEGGKRGETYLCLGFDYWYA